MLLYGTYSCRYVWSSWYLSIKVQRTTVCRRAFELWCFTVIIVTVIHYFLENLYIETIPLQYGLMLILFLSILITMIKTTSIASQDISMQSKCWVNQKKKINRTKSSVQYYSNYTTTYRIIWSGDIETNPGTGLSKPKCQVCDKTVRCNQNS